jgi:hypothetical protein
MVVYEEGQRSPVRRRKRDSVTDKCVERLNTFHNTGPLLMSNFSDLLNN